MVFVVKMELYPMSYLEILQQTPFILYLIYKLLLVFCM